MIKKGVIYYMDTMQFDNGAKRGRKGKTKSLTFFNFDYLVVLLANLTFVSPVEIYHR